jgi:hypothetical protein
MANFESSDYKYDKSGEPETFKWLASTEATTSIPEQYIDALASAPRKVDVLIRVDGTGGTVQAEVLQQLAHHPKVGTVIVYGMPKAQRILLSARAAVLGVSLRFCESEEEVRILLNKRRSRVITGNAERLGAGLRSTQTGLV